MEVRVALTTREQGEVDAVNASGRKPVLFVHGLWLLASSWDKWRKHFEDAGFATLAPGWPDDPETVAEARAHPEVFAGKSIKQITDHVAEVASALTTKPAIIGHSFGGLITQQLAGRGLAAVSVPIDPAPFRGVLPLPVSALRASVPVLGNPLNYRRAVMLTAGQFRYAFANAVGEEEAAELYA
jgi:pimeloyl-ACP methyl ester carboxylesterase